MMSDNANRWAAHKKWRLKNPDVADAAYREAGSKLESRSAWSQVCLVERGFSDPAAAESFLKPKLTDLHNPELLPGVVRAARSDVPGGSKRPADRGLRGL